MAWLLASNPLPNAIPGSITSSNAASGKTRALFLQSVYWEVHKILPTSEAMWENYLTTKEEIYAEVYHAHPPP